MVQTKLFSDLYLANFFRFFSKNHSFHVTILFRSVVPKVCDALRLISETVSNSFRCSETCWDSMDKIHTSGGLVVRGRHC